MNVTRTQSPRFLLGKTGVQSFFANVDWEAGERSLAILSARSMAYGAAAQD